ncbi:type III-B CRISPR-associated protein Cas10/Cmr2 [Clostridium sp.]|uniref:type III-B CRISPR-associated protein Cas10/Cmr2 n=1 Tax=Clostridium sp. TaxID=1506 RepID=UPI002FDD9054
MNNTDFNNTYIGLTIGPIFKTINYAKETGELWGSSYMFSYIIKNIISKLIVDTSIKDRFIVPYVNEEEIFKDKTEVGLFHDRFIFKSNKGDFKKVSLAVGEVKNCFKENVFKELEKIRKEEISKDIVYKYIDDYLKIYFLEVEVNPNDENEDNKNIILKVSKYLDALELRENFVDKEEKPYLFEILKNKSVKSSFLSEDAYGQEGKKEGYPSLINIALASLKDKKLPMEDSKIIDYINENYKEYNFKKVHEYVALVQADGDSIREVIKELEIDKSKSDEFESYKRFSKNLLKYAQYANSKIKEYGGFSIFAGGDDLLFIAPVINKDKNIFSLINDLSDHFNINIKENEKSPTASFGVAIIHHKFPLYYAIEEARSLLSEAKKFETINEKKNAIAFKIIKSSGESFKTVIGKNSFVYKEKFNLLISKTFQADKDEKLNNYLKSIHIKLWNDKAIINKIGVNKDMLKNYFQNNFNDEIHKNSKVKEYINIIIEFIHTVYSSDEKVKNDDESYYINLIYSCLKFVRFMDEKSEFIKEKGDKE